MLLGIAGVLAAGTIIALLELPPLWKTKRVKDIWIFSILLLAGLGLSSAQVARLPIPNPLDWIAYIYQPLSDLIFKWLG